MSGHITSLNRSDGGVPKLPITQVEITIAGLAGDRQRNLTVHGGPDRAVCLLAQEVIDALALQGHPIRPGSTGENLTIAGLDWAAMKPGDRLQLGDTVVLEITSHTKPCRNISASFVGGEFSCLDHLRHPGQARLYARVLVPGALAIGDLVTSLAGETGGSAPGKVAP